MPGLQTFLSRVKQRRQSSPLGRAAMQGLLVAWKAARRFPGSRYCRVRLMADGNRFWVRPFSYDDLLTISPDYESVLNRWRPRPGDTVVDAGAFIGRHTLAYARDVGPRGRVIAVEPHPENFRLLQRNVRANGYQNVTCVPCALSNFTGQSRLAYDRETSTSALATAGSRTVSVRVRTLDDLLAECQVSRVDLMKIDVEGAEVDVLRGAKKTLAAQPQPRLIIENHDPGPVDKPEAGKLRQWLDKHGIAVQEVNDNDRHFYVTEDNHGIRRSVETLPIA